MGSTWGDHFSSSSNNLVGSFLLYSLNSLQILKMRFFAIIFCVASTQAFLVRREADAEAEADAMDTELFPQLLFLPQCVALSPRKLARIEPLKPQDRFATPNMTKLLTPLSLNTAKRPSPPSVNRSAPRPDIAPVLLAMTPRLLPPVLLPPQK